MNAMNEEEKDLKTDETLDAQQPVEGETNPDAETAEPQEEEQPSAERELEELKDKYLRTVAEFENYKRRTLKEKTELILNGGEKAFTSILPIIDDM